jgi:hypothetical protein
MQCKMPAFGFFFWVSLSWVVTSDTINHLPVNDLLLEPDLPPNTNHIFNAIHSSMRQWGSSVLHNGMSLFIATVPQGVQFYHGTDTNQSVTGMEWLAFEPEHAMIFARQHGGGPPPGNPGGKRPGGPPPPLSGDRIERQAPLHGEERFLESSFSDRSDSPDDNPMELTGWLHTYSTNSDLRLLYIDGMSAGKSEKGTLDSQDYLLLNWTDAGEGFREYERAKSLCNMIDQNWEGRVDGFIRMEAGFEIIMCSFERSVDLVRITRARNYDHGSRNNDDHFAYIRAIAARYHGIGGGRVVLNYDDFVTAFDYPVDLFEVGIMPRLSNVSSQSLSLMRKDVGRLVKSSASATTTMTNWQSIADMVIQRYANSLEYLISDKLSLDDIRAESSRLLRPFHNFEFSNKAAEIDRCANQFISDNNTDSLGRRAVADISHLICSTLRSAEDENSLSAITTRLKALVRYLDWTTWRECKGCNVDEVCFVAIWPFGTSEDHESPSCRNATATQDRRGYWGGFGPRRPKDEEQNQIDL